MLALTAPAAAEGSADVEGQPIVRIVFARYDIFDTSKPETSQWFYRAANSLHIISKESFVRSRLLLKEGDLFHGACEESARTLRALGFINPVLITARRVDGGVEVTVETHDQCTLNVGGSFGVAGGREDWGIEFQEKNFLGLGKKLELEYASDVERSETAIGYYDPNIMGTWWQSELRYADRSDGFRELVRLERPFYALATPRAMGGIWDRDHRVDYLYSEGETVVSGPQQSEIAGVWYGFRLPAGAVTRRITPGSITITTPSKAGATTTGLPTRHRRPTDRRAARFVRAHRGQLRGAPWVPLLVDPGGRGARPQPRRRCDLLTAGAGGGHPAPPPRRPLRHGPSARPVAGAR
jgi:hypothetical protein